MTFIFGIDQLSDTKLFPQGGVVEPQALTPVDNSEQKVPLPGADFQVRGWVSVGPLL